MEEVKGELNDSLMEVEQEGMSRSATRGRRELDLKMTGGQLHFFIIDHTLPTLDKNLLISHLSNCN